MKMGTGVMTEMRMGMEMERAMWIGMGGARTAARRDGGVGKGDRGVANDQDVNGGKGRE
jgi:hypothetical protein